MPGRRSQIRFPVQATSKRRHLVTPGEQRRTTGVTAAMVRAKQPEYPDSVIVFQIVMFGAALLAAVPKKWVRFGGLVLLLAGVRREFRY
jgi:hypothetical protein